MSLLNQIPNLNNDLEDKALRIKYINCAMIKEMIRFWNESNDSIWMNPNPQGVLDKLGESAEEILEIDEQILNLLSNILGGRRQSDLDLMISKVSKRPKTLTDENGNVKII